MKPTSARAAFAIAITVAVTTAAGVCAHAESRELGAHEHGQGALNIAIEGGVILMEFEAPGADIVGFEYEARSAEDRAAVDAAIAALAKPLDLFTPPAGAGCVVTTANVALITEGDEHDEHGDEHANHAEEEHGHDDHAHDHDKHAEEGHEDEHHDADAHGEEHHDHDAHGDQGGEGHTEFHAEYALTCADPAAVQSLDFGYFAQFPNAAELMVQVISEQGAKAYEVSREDPRLDLSGAT